MWILVRHYSRCPEAPRCCFKPCFSFSARAYKEITKDRACCIKAQTRDLSWLDREKVSEVEALVLHVLKWQAHCVDRALCSLLKPQDQRRFPLTYGVCEQGLRERLIISSLKRDPSAACSCLASCPPLHYMLSAQTSTPDTFLGRLFQYLLVPYIAIISVFLLTSVVPLFLYLFPVLSLVAPA